MRRLLALGALVLSACTPAQARAWLAWHADDPTAAVAWLDTPEGQAALAAEHEAVTPGECSTYVPLFERHGLPVATFTRIAWRESGCDHRSYVVDHDDLGGGLLGLNLRAGAAMWRSWCGLTAANVTDAEVNVECAAVAYRKLGLRPWS